MRKITENSLNQYSILLCGQREGTQKTRQRQPIEIGFVWSRQIHVKEKEPGKTGQKQPIGTRHGGSRPPLQLLIPGHYHATWKNQ